MTDQDFSKYAERGAYHWNMVGEGALRTNPRLRARYDIPVRLLRERLDLRSARGLDVGCGDGVLLERLSRAGSDAAGLDYDADGLAHARDELTRRGVQTPVLRGSCYALPVKSGGLDYVTAVELIEHLDAVPDFLAEVERVLRPGGWFICTTPNRAPGQPPDEVRDPFHVKEFVAAELRAALETRLSSVSILGAHPASIDAIYLRDRRNGVLDRAIRVAFRAFARTAFNPYVRYLRADPDSACATLVGVARKGERG